MEGQENSKGKNVLNYLSMGASLIGIAGSIIAQHNGVTVPESNFLAATLSGNALFAILNVVKLLPDAIRLNTIRDPAEQKALFTVAINELGLTFLNVFTGMLCGYASQIGY